MQPLCAGADARIVIRLLATVVGAAFLLAGCSTEEGNRAQELLQQAEQAQTQLHSATFEVDLGAVADGEQIDWRSRARPRRRRAVISMHADRHPRGIGPGLSAGRPRQPRLDEHDQRQVGFDACAEGDERQERLDGSRRVPELARYVRDVRVVEHQQIGGKSVTTIAGEIDTAGLLKAVTKLGALSGPGGEKPAFAFDLDDLGLKIGDIKAVLSIDESTHLLSSALVTLSMDVQGKTLKLDLRYRLTSSNQPVKFPSVSG